MFVNNQLSVIFSQNSCHGRNKFLLFSWPQINLYGHNLARKLIACQYLYFIRDIRTEREVAVQKAILSSYNAV